MTSTAIPDYLFQAHGLPLPKREHRFCERRWRFDFAWPQVKLAVEVQGGIWTRGRHSRAKGMMGDFEKFNEATILGWRVLLATPQDVKSGKVFEVLRRALT